MFPCVGSLCFTWPRSECSNQFVFIVHSALGCCLLVVSRSTPESVLQGTTCEDRRHSLDGGAPPWAPETVTSGEGTSRRRRSSLGGGFPSWAAQNKEAGKSETSGDPGSGEAYQGRRPSLAGGMPVWAPRRGCAEANSCEGNRRPSLSGGMPAWAPASNAEQNGSTETLHESEAKSAEKTEATAAPVLPDWIAAATRASCGDVRHFFVSRSSRIFRTTTEYRYDGVGMR